MSVRAPITHIIILIVGLLIASFMQLPLLTVVLAEVRLLLVMVLGVALLYVGLIDRGAATLPSVVSIEHEQSSERGR